MRGNKSGATRAQTVSLSSVSVCKGVPHWALLKESRLQVTNFTHKFFFLLLVLLLLHTANTVVVMNHVIQFFQRTLNRILFRPIFCITRSRRFLKMLSLKPLRVYGPCLVLSCLINLITWIYNFNQEIKSDQHWASWDEGQQIGRYARTNS